MPVAYLPAGVPQVLCRVAKGSSYLYLYPHRYPSLYRKNEAGRKL